MLAAAYPSWSDDEVFDKARLVVAALIAKIHTVEWTTAILTQPALRIGMRANWFGLAEERVRTALRAADRQRGAQRHPRARPPTTTPPRTRSPRSSSRSTACTRSSPTSSTLRSRGPTRRRSDAAAVHGRRAAAVARPLLARTARRTCSTRSARPTPGAVTLHNHPRFMQHLPPRRRPARRPRRRGPPALPRARGAALQRVPPAAAPAARPASFEELTGDPATAAELRRGVRRRSTTST